MLLDRSFVGTVSIRPDQLSPYNTVHTVSSSLISTASPYTRLTLPPVRNEDIRCWIPLAHPPGHWRKRSRHPCQRGRHGRG